MSSVEEKMKIGKGYKAMSRFGTRTLSWPFTLQEADKIIEELSSSRILITEYSIFNTEHQYQYFNTICSILKDIFRVEVVKCISK